MYVFDTKQNFEKSRTNLGSEGSAFKRIICIEDAIEFEKEFALLPEGELAFMVVHVFYTDKINGIIRFVASRIGKKYPNLGFMYISEGDGKEINKQMIDAEIDHANVYKYHQVQSNLEDGKFKVYTKREILQLANASPSNLKQIESVLGSNQGNDAICDYVIITALEEDEMEKVLPMIEKQGRIKNEKHLIEYGHLKSNPLKTIAYASQQSTGMIDAAILATEMILRFHPKFLIMTGVLGGKPGEVKIGDIIVSNKVFTIDKGKITEDEIKTEIESVNLDSSHMTKFIREKQNILEFINRENTTRKSEVNILFGPIACVRRVIDKKGFFEENILYVDRKAIGLEMESYGVARACELVNDGNTTPLIIKAAMDNTSDKVDDAKTFAAWTSAMFVRYILEHDLI